jgi:hypothetical protein
MNIVILKQQTIMFCGDNLHLSNNYECKKWGLHFENNDERVCLEAIFIMYLKKP